MGSECTHMVDPREKHCRDCCPRHASVDALERERDELREKRDLDIRRVVHAAKMLSALRAQNAELVETVALARAMLILAGASTNTISTLDTAVRAALAQAKEGK